MPQKVNIPSNYLAPVRSILNSGLMPLLPIRRRRRKIAPEPHPSTAGCGEPCGEEQVNILRLMHPDCIEMHLSTRPSQPTEDETESQRDRRLVRGKEAVLQELADILDRSGAVINPTKFYKDMVNRERKATTGIVPGIAIPHVRSMQVRQFVMGFARADEEGVPFASLDGSATRLFFLLAAPPYEDKTYLKVYRQFAEMIRHEWIVDSFLDAKTPQDVLNILRGYVVQ